MALPISGQAEPDKSQLVRTEEMCRNEVDQNEVKNLKQPTIKYKDTCIHENDTTMFDVYRKHPRFQNAQTKVINILIANKKIFAM